MSRIAEILNDILDKRRNTVEGLIKKQQEAEAIVKNITELRLFANSMTPEQLSDYKQLFTRNPWLKEKLNDVKSMVECERLYDVAIEAVKQLILRFQRDTINITVVGDSRAGKSRFLQTVSGLDNNSVPSFEGKHCTGVRSIIQNNESMTNGVKAVFTFKTADDILAEVNYKLAYITGEKIQIESYKDLPEVSETEIRNALRTDWEEAAAEGYISDFIDMYVTNYDEWAPLIDFDPKDMDTFTMEEFSLALEGENFICTKPEDILLYLAKHDGQTPRGANANRLYRYIAVEKAKIYNKFALSDVDRLKLVDTVGLGDLATSTTEKMYDAIDNESDAVIFFFCPHPSQGGLIDNRIFDICNKELYPRYYQKEMKKWMAVLVNNHDNYEACVAFTKEFNKKCPRMAQNVVFTEIVNVADENEVDDLCLIPLLDSMANNIGSIDKRFMDELDTAMAAANEYFIKLASGYSYVEIPKKEHILQDNFVDMFNRLINRVKELSVKYANITDNLLESSIKAVAEVKETQLPKIIEKVHLMGTATTISEYSLAFGELTRIIKAIATSSNTDLERFERELKQKIAEIILDEFHFTHEKCPLASSENFFNDMSELLFGNNKSWSTLKEVFLSMHRFKLEGSLTVTRILFNHYINVHFNTDKYTEWQANGDNKKVYEAVINNSLEYDMRKQIEKFIADVTESDMFKYSATISIPDQIAAELNFFVQHFDVTYHRLWDNVLTAQLENEMLFKEEKLRIDEFERTFDDIRKCVETAMLITKGVDC